MFGHAQQRSFDRDQTFLDLVKGGLTREELEKLIAKRPLVYGGYRNWLQKLPSLTTKQVHFWAIRVNETQYWNLDVLRQQFGEYTPTAIWAVYLVLPEQHVHMASLTPSCRADFLHFIFDIPLDTPDDVRDRIEEEGNSNPNEDTYFNTRDVERIIEQGSNASDLGLYDSEEEDDRDAWEAAREHAQGNSPF